MSERGKAFEEAMASLIEEYRDVIAPSDDDTDEQIPGTVNTGWLLIHTWSSVDARAWYEWVTDPAMLTTQVVGLLVMTQADAMPPR